MNDETTAPVEGVKLSACPFCGSAEVDPEGWASHNPETDERRVGPACDDCGASAESVEAWNRRAPTHGVGREDGSSVADSAASACGLTAGDAQRKSDGERLCEAFAETFQGGGWADAPAWGDFDEGQQDRWNRTARIFLADTSGLKALLLEVRDACLYAEDDGEIGVTSEPTIDSDLFDRICAAIKGRPS